MARMGTLGRVVTGVVGAVVAATVCVGTASPAAAGTTGGYQGPIYFADGSGIVRINPDGTGRQVIVPRNGSNWNEADDPAISPDGTRLLFSAIYPHDIPPTPYLFVVNLTSGSLTPSRSLGGEADFVEGQDPTWSPDGQSVAYRGRTTATDSADLYRIPFSDGIPRRLTHLATGRYAENPEWSPDGQWIAFASVHHAFGPGGGHEVIVTAADAVDLPSQVIATLPNEGVAPAPSWRPDSRRLAYDIDGSGLYVADIGANGGATGGHRVFGSRPLDRFPVFAPAPDAGTEGDTILTQRSAAEFVVLRSTQNAGSLRGPFAGGRGASWSVGSPPLPTTPLPVVPAISPLLAQLGSVLCPVFGCRPGSILFPR